MDAAMDAPITHDQQKKLRDGYDLMHKTVLKSMNAYAIVLSILLASTYAGFSQFPKPLDGNTEEKSSNFQKIFTYFNGFSFFSSVTGLLFFASGSLSTLLALDTSGELTPEKEVDKKLDLLASTLPKLIYVIFFFGVSLTCAILAFVFAGFSTVPDKISEQLPVIITTAIGGFVYIQALGICCTDTYRIVSVSVRQNKKLWTAMKRGTLFGMLLGRYVDFLSRHLEVSDTRTNGLWGSPTRRAPSSG